MDYAGDSNCDHMESYNYVVCSLKGDQKKCQNFTFLILWNMKFRFFSIIFPYINPGICKIKLRTLFDPSNMQKGTKFEQFFWRKIILKFWFGRSQKIGKFIQKIVTSWINFHEEKLLPMGCAWKIITHRLLNFWNPLCLAREN